MQYLRMAQAVREHIVLQGTGPSAITAIGSEGLMLHMVRDAWSDLQNYRSNWKWMRDTKQFATVAGTTVYPIATIFGPVNRFKRWYKDSFYITIDGKKELMYFKDYDYFTWSHRNDTSQGEPNEFTVRPQDYSIVLPAPNGVYWVEGTYYKNNQELTTATTEPELPVDYHTYIVYEATARYALSIGLRHVYQEYAQKAAEMLGDILREQNPRKVFKVRGIA